VYRGCIRQIARWQIVAPIAGPVDRVAEANPQNVKSATRTLPIESTHCSNSGILLQTNECRPDIIKMAGASSVSRLLTC
jgi:hypothetical protein